MKWIKELAVRLEDEMAIGAYIVANGVCVFVNGTVKAERTVTFTQIEAAKVNPFDNVIEELEKESGYS